MVFNARPLTEEISGNRIEIGKVVWAVDTSDVWTKDFQILKMY